MEKATAETGGCAGDEDDLNVHWPPSNRSAAFLRPTNLSISAALVHQRNRRRV